MQISEENLDEVSKKAELLAFVHSEEFDRKRRASRFLTLLSILVSLLLLIFSLAPIDEISSNFQVSEFGFKIVLAILAVFSLFIGIFLLVSTPGNEASSHKAEAIKYIRIKKILDRKLQEKLDESAIKDIREMFLSSEGEPIISSKRFSKLKKRYYLEKSYRSALVENPTITFRNHKKNLSKSS